MENFVSQPRKQTFLKFGNPGEFSGWKPDLVEVRMSKDRWKIVEECGVRRALRVKGWRDDGQVCPGGR